MPDIDGRLGVSVYVDMVVEKAIIHPNNTIEATILEPEDKRGEKVRADHYKLINEDGVQYAVTSKGKLGLVTRTEHQSYVYTDLRK